MTKHKQFTQQFKHVCPRKCPSSCTMVSYVKNDRLLHIKGDSTHPYTKGKLCAKAFSYIEKNNHHDRLKYPYYQKIKGSGKFKRITWDQAYDLIISEMMNIYKQHDHFLPLALYKGTGNVGVHHYVTDDFFSSIGTTTRVNDATSLLNSYLTIQHSAVLNDKTKYFDSNFASIILIWGANPAVTNIHLIPYLLDEKIKGTKIVVIDPLYTQTAELADLYIQLRPSTDRMLANLLIQGLIEDRFGKKNTFEINEYKKTMAEFNSKVAYLTCDIAEEAISLLLQWLKDTQVISIMIGAGIQKHANVEQTIHAIKMVAAIHEDTNQIEGNLYCRNNNSMLFNNQIHLIDHSNRVLHSHELSQFNINPSIEFMWITCANPIVQHPNPKVMSNSLKEIPFVVTVDQFMTPTAQMSNLVLPTTTHFEEMDIVTSFWHSKMALNEQALSPYYESKSEWQIMKDVSSRLNKIMPNTSSFTAQSSEEAYLNAQFNDNIYNCYAIKSIDDLKANSKNLGFTKRLWQTRDFTTQTMKPLFESKTKKESDWKSIETSSASKMPTSVYPFWLLTPHAPYTFNSQFHYLHLNNESEAVVEIHPKVAKELNIFNGEVIQIYNEQTHIEIKSLYSRRVPKDTIVVYQGWYPNSDVFVNDLISLDAKTNPLISNCNLYDTFVNIKKL